VRLVILESPYAASEGASVEDHILYARRCVHDSLLRGESPIASHLLYTQPGVLDDDKPEERAAGIAAGHAWLPVASLSVVYEDYGISRGMTMGIEMARTHGIVVEKRTIGRNQKRKRPGSAFHCGVDHHCYSRACLRGSSAGDRSTALHMPESFNPKGCECNCSGCYSATDSGNEIGVWLTSCRVGGD
jgi:hypothetical protein